MLENVLSTGHNAMQSVTGVNNASGEPFDNFKILSQFTVENSYNPWMLHRILQFHIEEYVGVL